MKDLFENKSQWPNLCDTITSFNKFSLVPPISQVYNDLISSITGENDKIPSVGNTWCITNICEIYEM